MNIVIVDGDISYPATSGKRLRTLNLMLRLARRHQITYVCRGNGHFREANQAVTFLRDHGIKPIVVDDPVPVKKGSLFYARLAANLVSPIPYSVASFKTDQMRRTVTDYASNHRVDVWQFEWLPYAMTLPGTPAFRKVIVAHNVESLLWQRYYETEKNAAKRWYIKQQWRKFERYERHVLNKATRVITVSRLDAALLRRKFGVPLVDVVDNGIDNQFYSQVLPQRDSNRILFLGSLEWRPNLDAVDLLLDEIFPKVLAKAPAATLSIVGRNPPDSLHRRVRAHPKVELHANVEDVRPFLGQSGVMAVPLRIGGGSRLKILEALATGLPVISTAMGAEGLCLRPGRDLVVVNEVDAMAEALVNGLRDPAKILAMAQQGRRLVLKRYDWDILASKLEKSWEKCLLS